ncbi:MAG: tetratricopeptide repeat protein, partial [Candidatus Dormibacteraceae bacterium]
MASIKKFLANRILISLLIILTLACAFEFCFHPFGGPFYKSGLQAYKSGNYKRSVRMLQEARKYEPNNPAILTLLGWALLKTGKPAVAEKRFRSAHRLTPHEPELQLGLAYAEIDLDHPNQAGAILNEIRRDRPGWDETRVAQAVLFRREGLPRMAAMEFHQALLLAPHNADILKNLREISAENTTLPPLSAEESRRGLIAFPHSATLPSPPQNPTLADQDLSAARTLESRDEFPEAIARYKTYLASNPRSVSALYGLGELLLKTGQPQEAVPVFSRILSVGPQDAGGTLGLAESLAATGQYREALFRYRQFLKAWPGNYEAQQGMANTLLWTGRYSAAKPLFEALANKDSKDPVNQQALQAIATAGEEAHWASLRPSPGSPPVDFVRYDQAYLTTHPGDHSTLVELAANQTKLR